MTNLATLSMIVLAALYLGLLALKAGLARRAWRRERRERREEAGTVAAAGGPSGAGAGVTIAQAILSGDPRLGAVLAANVEALPGACFLWLVDTDDETAWTVCRDIVARQGGAGGERIEILRLPPPLEGHNPKLHKLHAAFDAAEREPVLLVLDDDTRMPAATLAALQAALARAALASSLPGYLDDGRWPSRLLAQFVNNNAALTYLPLLAFLPPLTINGMAYAMRRDTLAAIGGFAPLLGYLTDDLAVAQRTLAAGGTIVQSARPHWVETTVRDGRHYLQLMHRWFLFALLLMARQPLRLRLAIAVLDALPPLLLVALVLSTGWAGFAGFTGCSHAALACGVLGATLALRALGLAAVQRAVYGRSLHAPFTSLASELLQPLHLLHAVCWRRIVWRKRRYRVRSENSFTSIA